MAPPRGVYIGSLTFLIAYRIFHDGAAQDLAMSTSKYWADPNRSDPWIGSPLLLTAFADVDISMR
jgi:hypothetical protein